MARPADGGSANGRQGSGDKQDQSSSGYRAPPSITSSLVPDGNLVDVDTAEVTALPEALSSASGTNGAGNGSSSSTAATSATPRSKAAHIKTSPSARSHPDSSSLSPLSPTPGSADSALGRPTSLSTSMSTSIASGPSSDVISRPSSAAGMKVQVDRPSADALNGRSLYSHPPNDDADYDTIERLFAHRGGAPPYGNFNLYRRLRFAWTQLVANVLSSSFLILVVIWALSVRLLAQLPRFFSTAPPIEAPAEWDDPDKWAKEGLVKDVRYYAQKCGFEIRNETVKTEDGYYLRMNRVICPERAHEKHSDGRGGYPVLIMHGLFQSSGSFVTSEERSLAFWLARHGGYQVFLGNNRGVFDMGHERLSRSDPRFWDYNIRELAIYDLPAMVDYVRKETGYDKIAFIGHSQGNGTAFISLSKGMAPELGDKLSYFGALAPAVFAGPLTSCFPFTTMGSMDWKTWKRFFGVLDFIPLMKISYDYTPAYPYALLGYQMFAFLFAWTDANWLPRRKAKMFRFTPQPVSSTSIYWWAGKDGFASRGCILDPQSASPWWDERFPPLSIFSGGMDFLVLTDPLVERLETVERHVRVLRFRRQDEAEHCDHFWAADAVEWCFHDILEDIELTRTLYPEEAKTGKRVVARVSVAGQGEGEGEGEGEDGQRRDSPDSQTALWSKEQMPPDATVTRKGKQTSAAAAAKDDTARNSAPVNLLD